MGSPKSDLVVDGRPMAEGIADKLAMVCPFVTVLGREPVGQYEFLGDAEVFGGPLAALSRFAPRLPYVFVASCDMPHFDPIVICALRARIGNARAQIPAIDGFAQSLCGLYDAGCFVVCRDLVNGGERSMRALLNAVNAKLITSTELEIDRRSLASANTPAELASLLTES
jgi:molybdopterin-guanine dinucleotide biosynthesis protein A